MFLRFSRSLILAVFFFSASAWAFPNLERPNNPDLKPLPLALDSQADAITVSPDDRWIVLNQSDKIVLIDTASWEIAEDQPEALSASIGGFGFLSDSDELFAYSSDGVVTRILTDDPLGDLLEVDVSDQTSTGTGPLLIDSEDSGHLFFLNQSSKKIFEYDVSSQNILGSVAIDATTVNPKRAINKLLVLFIF